MSDHPYSLLIIGGFGSGNINALLNPISHRPDVDKICSYAKVPTQLLINNAKVQASKVFIKCFNNIDDIYENIEEHNPAKECKILLVFDDLIAGMFSVKTSRNNNYNNNEYNYEL